MNGADLSVVLAALAAKSLVIAALGLAAARWLGRSPAERVVLLRVALALILALPFVAALAPDLALAVLPASEPILPAVASEFGPMWTGQLASVGDISVAAALPWPTFGGLLAAAWIVGAAALAARLILGLHTLSRWTEQGEAVAQPHWRDWLARLSGPHAAPRLIASPRIGGPLSWGARPGVILVDPASLAARDTAPAILAHELAHLHRRDWIFLMLSRLALAAFWFNPLVWRLHAALVEASEEAADAEAAQAVGRETYARTLVRLAAHPSPFAATAMAADAHALKKRIALLMTETAPARRRPVALGLGVAGLAALATPLAALELHNRAVPAAVPVAAAMAVAAREATAPRTSTHVVHVRSNGRTYVSVPHGSPLPRATGEVVYLRPEDMPPAPPPPPAPPAPPAPPMFPTAFAPPAPPAQPAPPAYSGQNIRYRNWEDLSPAERRQIEEARATAAQAREHAADALRQAAEALRAGEEARRAGETARREARRAGEEARRQGEQARVQARVQAEQARAHAARAREDAQHAHGQAKVQMRQGADQMRVGARQMREEGQRLRDPAYRAEQIARNRRNGQTVTDEQLRELSATLPRRADELERRADDLAARADGRD